VTYERAIMRQQIDADRETRCIGYILKQWKNEE